MSNLNITRNIFLEKEELTRFQQFLADDITQKLFVKNTIAFGIVLSDFVNVIPLDFLIQVGTNVGTIKLTQDSFALDSEGLLITQKAFDNLAVPNDGNYYWVKATHKFDPTEVGTCSINTEGQVVGVNTLFQDVLRGQSTEVPVKVRFIKTDGTAVVNDQVYEIVDVTDNLNILLTGGSFTAESNLKYIVIGCTPISEAITATQLTGLYQYDACNLQLIAEEVVDTIPVINYVVDKDFYLARVKNTTGTVTITDKRQTWWEFNIPGLGDKMVKSANLSDLFDVPTARLNLDVFSKSEVENLLGVTTTIVTTFESKSAQVASVVGYGAYNNYSVVMSGVMTINSGTTIAAGQLLFKMRIPSMVTATPLAFFTTTQPGSFDNSRTGTIKFAKNGDYVEAYALTTVFDTATQPFGFNVTWLR
jgi:hypothetical protein